jgi:pimeloyl-ACP methyl ester carboxylesterase
MPGSHVRPGSRRVARRLVLAARCRPAASRRPQGFYADIDRRRRAFASVARRHRSENPHQRRRQCDEVGERLTDVVLCGHSYGGFVISGVAEQMAPAIRSIVFLDAFVPHNGESGAAI